MGKMILSVCWKEAEIPAQIAVLLQNDASRVIEALRAEIDVGIVALDSGRFTEVADEELDQFLDQIANDVAA